MKTYDLEVVLVECTDDKRHEIVRRELGRFRTEKEAREVIELVELPDPDHLISI
jgi:hypothetical protein